MPTSPDDEIPTDAAIDLGGTPSSGAARRRLSLRDAVIDVREPRSLDERAREGAEREDSYPHWTVEAHRAWLTSQLGRLGPPVEHDVPLPEVGAEAVLDEVAGLRPRR